MEGCQPHALGCPASQKKAGLPQLLSGRPFLLQPALLANCPARFYLVLVLVNG